MKKKDFQLEVDKLLHAITENDNRKLFPFLRKFVEKPVSSSKIVYELSEKECNQILRMARFFEKEIKFSYTLGEEEGKLHRKFLWHSSREHLRILWFFRQELRGGDVAKKLGISYQDLRKKQMIMYANGCYMSKTPAEVFFEKQITGELRMKLDFVFSILNTDRKPIFDTFFQKVWEELANWDKFSVLHACAAYYRGK